MTSLQEFLEEKFESWKPLPPEVERRSSRDVTLIFSAGPYSFLKNRLIFRVEKKEKIPSWITVYSGGKTKKTIDNLAPSHPHRFRFKVIIKSSAIEDLERAAIEHYGDEKTVYEVLKEIDESEDLKQSKENNSSGVDDKAKSVPSYTMDCEKQPLSRRIFEEKPIDKSNSPPRQYKWLSSQWSEETWTSTDSNGTSVVCFCMAVRFNYISTQVQQMLEDRPALISVVNANNGYTPLATAARKGDVSMVRFLLSADAEIEQPSSTGQTPLHLAVLAGHVAVADLLLEKGADFQARDFNRLGIEHYAVDSCKLEMVKYIFGKGGDVGAKDSNAWTPLFRAVCQGAKTDIIEELVRRGSDVDAVDRAGLSVAAAARLLKDRHGRRRESVLRLVDSQFQHEKVVANFTRLTKKISSVHTLLSIK
ncbi:CARD- and ANK-domain containing inflammasome adapter protein-like [Vanessa cardui]|uniref:CARD- and ANK-domain containing inflammasome adapter protein-like n=1 Tax=Vanessa cardui TaxID=171605 RepID=UPI001F13D2E8|nr:CARD- and ANK-domain containing inflammasome adapter protein-like [Vanessa cardui]